MQVNKLTFSQEVIKFLFIYSIIMRKSLEGGWFIVTVVIDKKIWVFFHSVENELHDRFESLFFFGPCGRPEAVVSKGFVRIKRDNSKKIFETSAGKECISFKVKINVGG